MDNKKVFFWAPEDRPFTHKEAVYVISYKLSYPNDEVSLCLHSPSTPSRYTNWVCETGVPLLWIKAEISGEPEKIPTEALTDENIMSFPFFNMAEYMFRSCNSESNILDLGCGNKGMINQFPTSRVVTVDAFAKFNPDILWDLNHLPLPFDDNSFDIVLLLDVIEHLDKPFGMRLLMDIKRIVKKRVFVFTPLWWQENDKETLDPSSDYYQNKFNYHHSLWTPEDFPDFKRVEGDRVKDYFFGYWNK